MKIHEKTVFDMETLEIIEDVSYEYEGDVALCKGSETTTNVTTIPEKTIEEHELDKLNLRVTEKSVAVQEQALQLQREAYDYQAKVLPRILATQERLLPLQEAEAEFYLKTMPQQLAIAGKQLGITEKQIALQEQQMGTQAELFPLQKELYGLQLEQAKKALAGEPLATEEQKKTLRTMTDQFKENAIAGLEDIGNTLYEKAVQKGLARGIPLSDIARSFEGEVGKYIASEKSSIEREGERMYTQGLTNYPTAMAEFAQRISQAPGSYSTTPLVSSGGYAIPPMDQLGGKVPSFSTPNGIDNLNRLLSQLKSERYGLASSETRGPDVDNTIPLILGVGGAVAGGFFGGPMGAAAGFGAGTQAGMLLR